MKFPSFSSLLQSFIKGIVFWFWVIFIVFLVSFVYASISTNYPSLSNVVTGSGLSATSWNDLVNYANKAIKQDSEILTVTGGKVGIGTISPGAKLDIVGDVRVWGKIQLDDIPAWWTWSALMLGVIACSQKPANTGWIWAVKLKGSWYSNCSQVCANNGPYYVNCRGMVSVRDFGRSWVNVAGWACTETTYATYDEMYCCCSY